MAGTSRAVQCSRMSSADRHFAHRVGTTLVALVAVALVIPAVAFASYKEDYGPQTICGSPSGNCYISTAGAHTFVANVGQSVGTSTYLACQLFNGAGVNVVGHGYQVCTTSYPGGQYLWARVYNESAFSDTVAGEARTG
jgi:hypothetical protein